MKNNLAHYRKLRGLTQDKLAQKANVSRPYISEIETNPEKIVTNMMMVKLATALDISVSDIFFADAVV